jgi:hypothetical protein
LEKVAVLPGVQVPENLKIFELYALMTKKADVEFGFGCPNAEKAYPDRRALSISIPRTLSAWLLFAGLPRRATATQQKRHSQCMGEITDL